MSPEATTIHVELEARLRFETLIADLLSKFINLAPGEVDHEILFAQRRICELLNIDLSSFWQWSDEDGGCFTLTHQYSLDGGPQAAGRMRHEDFPWSARQLLEGRVVAISSLDKAPLEAAKDREVARQFGIKSSLCLPLAVGGEPPLGLLCLNTTRAERDWPDALVQRLQLVAQIFTNALARKRADQALREGGERMMLAAEAAQVGVWGWNIARNEVWGSERWLGLFGFPAGEHVSFEKVIQRIHPDDRQTVERDVRGALANQSHYAGEFRVVLPDGTQRWIASRGRGYPDANGTPGRMLGTALDITERKRTEEALRTSEARLAGGTELAGLGYYEVDYAERTCFLDDRFREICGVPPDLQQGLEPVAFWLEHIHPDERQRVSDERQALHEGTLQKTSTEYRYVHPTQGQRWIHHLARVTKRNTTRHTVCTFGVVRDITQHKRAEMEALELRGNLTHLTRVNTLGVLSGSLAHELNQPLGIILSNAQAAQELLQQDPPDLAEVQAILADIVKADRRAGDVIERLRALLKRGQVSLRPLTLNHVIEEVLHLTRADLIGRGVNAVCDLAPDLPPIAGDRVQLQQLVLNLILNAAEAMASNAPGARRLHLQTRFHQGRVRLAVRDEGPGLPADTERLFQPFYTTKREGLGMGLAICRSIVAAHHGRIWAEVSPAPGAVFYFELPVAGSPDTP